MKIYKFLLTMALTAMPWSVPCRVLAQETLLWEDFSKCTAGTQDKCDDTNIGKNKNNMYGTCDIDTYMQTTGWSGYGIYQADGTVVIKGFENYGMTMAQLDTPYVPCDGDVTVTLRARIYPDEAVGTSQTCMLRMQNKKSESSYIEADITDKWQEFTYSDYFAGENIFSLIVGTYGNMDSLSPIQVDWVKIEKSDEVSAPAAPEATAADRRTNTSFRARWNTVNSVDYYLLYVAYEDEGETKFHLEGEQVSAPIRGLPTKEVTGLNPDCIYSYYVKSVRGGVESQASNIIDVVYLAEPELSEPEEVTADSFSISWTPVAKASGYTLDLFKITVSGREEAGTFTTAGTSYAFTGLDPEVGRYAVEVRAYRSFNGIDYFSYRSLRKAVELTGIAGVPSDEILAENFAGFTNGSETSIYYKEAANSDDRYVSASSNDKNHIPDSYTQTPGWKGLGVAEAGGVAAVATVPQAGIYEGGYIKTPSIDAKGYVTIKARVRAIAQYRQATKENPVVIPACAVLSGDWSDTAMDYDILGHSEDFIQQRILTTADTSNEVKESDTSGFVLTDNEWHEVFFTIMNYSNDPVSIRFGLRDTTNDPFFIDDISILMGKTGVDAPVATQAGFFVKDGFTAFWDEAKDAEGYLLSVYSYNEGEREYAITDAEVSNLYAEVSGLDPWKDYFYNVKATLGTLVSVESNEVAAFGVSAPEVLEAVEIGDSGFTARWERTPKATRYDLTLYKVFDNDRAVEINTIDIPDGDTFSCDITGLNPEDALTYAYDLRAYYDVADATYMSDKSAREYVKLSYVGVYDVSADTVSVASTRGLVTIITASDTMAEICNINGIRVAGLSLSAGTTSIPLAAGMYIVKIGGCCYKVII